MKIAISKWDHYPAFFLLYLHLSSSSVYPVQSIVCVSLQLLSHFSKSKKTLETAWFGVSSRLSFSLTQSLVS